jgi:hypothetical protein
VLELKRKGVFDKKTEKLLLDFYLNAAISTILNHKSVFLVDKGGFNISSLISVQEFDDLLSDTMLNVGSRRAYSTKYFNGKTERPKLQRIYGELGKKKVMTRKEAIYVVGMREGLFPNKTKVGQFINKSIGL